MIYPFVAVSAVVPSLLLMWYFQRRDVFREPARDLWLVFGGGVLIVAPVLAFAQAFDPWIRPIASPLGYGLASAFVQAAIPEELFKLVVVLLAARRAVFDEPMDGMVYGVAASLGFATLENIVYVAGGGAVVALTRALTAVPSHAFLGAIMGFCVGQARFDPRRRRSSMAFAFLVPVLLHGLYDWPLLAAARVGQEEAGSHPSILALLSLAPLIVVAEWICAVRLARSLRRAQLRTLPAGDALHRVGPAERRSTLALTIGGALVASVGGMVTLGTSWVVAAGSVAEQPLGQVVATIVLLGVTPTLIGVALFLWGIRRLNEARMAPTG